MNLQKLLNTAAKCWQQGDTKGAKKAYKKVIAIDPRHYRAINNLASIMYISKDYAKAEELLRQAIQVAPDLSEAHINLGNIYSITGQLDQAISTFSDVIKLEPNNYVAYHQLGLCFFKLKELDNALNAIKLAVRINPSVAELFVLFGQILEAKGVMRDAANAYEQALRIQPTHMLALTNLGAVFLYMGDKDSAINAYENALQYYPDELGIYYFLSGLTNKYLNSDLKRKVETALASVDAPPTIMCYALFIQAQFANLNGDFLMEMKLLSQAHHKFLETKNFQKEASYYLEELQLYAEERPFTFTKEGIDQVSIEDMSPIFIVGAPRSGSTLIENIICAADKGIVKGEETSIIDNELFKLSRSEAIQKNWLQLGKKVLTRYKELGVLSGDRFTDKSLENVFMIGFILDLFPNARIVYCKRNPISSATSILKNNLSALSWAHDLEGIFKYLECSSKAYHYWKNEHPESIYEIDYDLLVTDQVGESKKLLEFCQLPWSEQCLNFHKEKNIVSKTASASQIRSPIHSDSINKFKQYELFFDPYKKAYKWLSE